MSSLSRYTSEARGAAVGLLLLGAAVAGLGGCSQAVTRNLVTGRMFPDITLTRLNGATTPFTDYRGKLVVLNVWATWCGPCRRELPSLEHLHKLLDPARFAVIALSVDSDDYVVHEYLRDRRITLTSYIDKDTRIADGVFGVRVYPDTFVIGPHGRLLGQYAGGRRWDSPKVVAAIRAARNGKPLAL